MSTLAALRDLLRDESRWPEGFRFDYGDFETCAVGLAHRAGLVAHQGRRAEQIDPIQFGIDEATYSALFVSTTSYRQGLTTASHIADRIDDWLTNHPEHAAA